MAKREWPLRFVCGHDGCFESVTYRYPTRRDLMSSYELKWHSNGRWKCLRHSDLDRVLSADNRETRFEVVSEQKEHGRYFGGSGLVTGPGFLCYASDLPPGTKLIVTARIEFPEMKWEAPFRGHCGASSDGECGKSWCPQIRDGEPLKTGRSCPLGRCEED